MAGGTLLLWVIRVIILAIVLRLVVRALTGGARTAQSSGKSRRPPGRLAGHLVRDPQCGTYVPQDRAVSMGGTAGPYFCSTACRDAWATEHAAGHAVR